MTSNGQATAPPLALSSIVSKYASPPTSTTKTDGVSPVLTSNLSIHTDEPERPQLPNDSVNVEASEVASRAHQQQGGTLTFGVPPVPMTRGPGHTPRGSTRTLSKPPQRPPSRTSSRYCTPLLRGDSGWSQHVTKTAAPMPKSSFVQSERSIQFVEDELTQNGSILFQVHPTALNHRTEEPGLNALTYSDGSDIHFTVDESQRGERCSNVPALGTTAHSGASMATPTSLHFEVHSTNDEARHSFFQESGCREESVRGQEVLVSHLSIDRGDDANEAAAKVVDTKEASFEFVSASEERRRGKEVEEERRKQALQERSQYMNIRPWKTNEPNPRARRTSSQSAAYALQQEQATKMKEAEKRRQAMNARPWYTNSATPNSSRAATPTVRKRSSALPSARSNNGTVRAECPVTLSSKENEVLVDRNIPPANLAAHPQPSSPVSEDPCSSVAPTPYAHPRSPAQPNDTAKTPATPPPPAVFDPVVAAKFVTPAPVLKAPLEIIGEEVEDWTQTVNQLRNLQAIAEVMRARERTVVQLSSQLAAKSSVMKRLNKELYKARDDHVRRLGCDLTGAMLCSSRSRVTPRSSSRPSTSRPNTSRPPSIVRLYTEPQHQAKDYYSIKTQDHGPQPVSVLSDDELSESEKVKHALDLQRWRVERAALRDTKARAVHRRRDLAYQMRRGSNIKDISTIQPTSGRGPLERAAAGTETAVDVNGYDRLMDLRLYAQRATVEAANAKKAYETTMIMEATVKKQCDLSSPGTQSTKESHNKEREQYAASLQGLQRSVQEARSLLQRAEAKMARRRKSPTWLDEGAELEMRDFSEALFAVRRQADRAEEIATAAPDDEDRMLRSASTPRLGTSLAGTPRGSINGFARPRTSPRIRGSSASNGGGVLERLSA
ncbi:hypothetical protein JKF63_04608 [Porcisia hertigi]|uniref:Uncharacterized protein n=1 Tax=Porcisia hertigi TaxID=2761500 RepID=A0A836I4M0_9TRYP|nr:hypothetical protein JKF63_04608 [Porcisia hertigi]